MPPFEFLKRPVRWLELIDRHWLDVSLAPNFAYQMCVTKGDRRAGFAAGPVRVAGRR